MNPVKTVHRRKSSSERIPTRSMSCRVGGVSQGRPGRIWQLTSGGPSSVQGDHIRSDCMQLHKVNIAGSRAVNPK